MEGDESPGAFQRLWAGTSIRYAAKVMYDGERFNGFQLQRDRRQPNTRTVQGELEAALQRRFQNRVPVLGASRTDTGVHARGQVRV
jgi:tRNA pseudouridine38-40 synthase